MRELAARLGVSAMTPYRYFKDKDEILAAVRARAFERFANTLEAAFGGPGAAQEKSQAVSQAYLKFALEESAAYRLMFDLSQPSEEKFPISPPPPSRARATMTGYVRLLVQEGYYEGDPELIGHVMWAALHGVVVLHLAGKLPGQPDFAALRTETMRALHSVYRKT